MTKKILKIPVAKKHTMKEKIINKLRLKYPRLECNNVEFESILPEEQKYYPNLMGGKGMKLAKTLAGEGYVKWGCAYLDDLIGVCLEQVVYRALKAVYGLPDFLAFKVLKKDVSKNGSISATGRPMEWGYSLQGEDGSRFEILRRIRDGFPNMILWLPYKEKPKEISGAVEKGCTEFLSLLRQLVEILDYEYSIKQEQSKLRQADHEILRGVTNLYYENLKAGRDMIELAEEWLPGVKEAHQDLFSKGQWIEASKLFRKESMLYVSAILFFLMALEGFVNLLYKFFLKPQFMHREYERSVWKTDFDLRMLHLPVYCKGFSNADITPDDMTYKHWLKIRPFRNNLIHANITEENEAIMTFEDGFPFNYNPLFHLKNIQKRMHTQQLYISKEDVLEVQEIVEQIVAEIIEKMDEKEKAWVRSWIGQIPIVLWHPGIEDEDYAASIHTRVLNDEINGK